MISTKKRRTGSTAMRRPMWVLAGAVGAGAVGYRVLRRKAAGSANAMFGQDRMPGSVVENENENAQAAPSDERITANERSDGLRRTGDDRLVRPKAAGEPDADTAADPTIAPDSAPGRPTGAESTD
ncbi:hypothetical protein [Kribbella swartbergensis]